MFSELDHDGESRIVACFLTIDYTSVTNKLPSVQCK